MKKNHLAIAALTVLLFFVPLNAFPKDVHGTCVVILDAGHGGSDEGVRVSMSQDEKDLTLKLVLALKNSLEKTKLIRVILTRADDRDVSLAQRINIGKGETTDLFLSVHVNAGFGKNAAGYELYYPGFAGSGGEGKGGAGAIVNDMVRTKALNESVRFAKVLQKHFDRALPRKDRDLREGPVLLRELNAPALLLEIGFATNPKDKSEFTDSSTGKEIVGAMDSSIREFLGLR